VDHPITREVRDWPDDATLAPPPGEGWQPIVTANGRPCVAVRQWPARQVWIGFDSATFARRPDFVVFWTNVFDWLAGEDEYTSEPVRPLSSEWQRDDAVCGPRLTADPTTGVFRSPAGGLVALNALDLGRRIVPAAGDWSARLAALGVARGGSWPLAPGLLVVAMVVLAVGAATWTPVGRRVPERVDVASPGVA
jgi:hypothetical protein